MNLIYVLLAILMLGVVIMIHELGHFLVGRACGIGVVEFSIGMGPLICSTTKKGTQYSLRALPLGGYCKFVGEDADDTSPNAMNAAPVWKRFLTVLAGPAMNFALAYVLAVALCLAYPQTVDIRPVVDEVVEATPAAEAGLLPGDVVTLVDGEAVSQDLSGVEAIRAAIRENDEITLTVERGGETFDLTLAPAEVTEDGAAKKQIGVVFSPVYAHMGFFDALSGAAAQMREYSTFMLDILRDLIFKFKGAENLAGPIGTVAVVSEQLRADWLLIFDFALLISLNLGIMNLIPFPGLDGSRLLFLVVEAIRRKPIPPEKEGLVHAVGLVILLALAAVLAVHDIMTYVL